MSLNTTLYATRRTDVFTANITHNCAPMAKAAGIYTALWRPEDYAQNVAAPVSLLLPVLRDGLERLRADPATFIALEPENKWGTYADFVRWLERVVVAMEENQDAEMEASR